MPESVSNLDQRGGRISALRHEPFNIRKYLIKDLENRGIIKIKSAPQEPWETYKNFKELLLKPAKPYNKRNVSEILGTDFNARLVKYLEVLQECVSPTQKTKVSILIEAIQFINQMQGNIDKLDKFDKIGVHVGNAYCNCSLEEIYSKCQGILPAQGADKSDRNKFDNFIGLCLFLSAASKLTYKRANDLVINPPFEKLPFT